MQVGSITTNIKFKIDVNLPELITVKIVLCNCPVDESAKGIYDITLVRNLVTALGLNLKLSDHVIEVDGGDFKESTAPTVVLDAY